MNASRHVRSQLILDVHPVDEIRNSEAMPCHDGLQCAERDMLLAVTAETIELLVPPIPTPF